MEVLGLVARGGFGRVERVRLAGGAVVARKVFDPTSELAQLDREKLRKRFVHEVETQRRLAPYGVIPVLEADLDAEPPWFTMPLAEGSFRRQIEADRAAGVVSAQPLVDILDSLEEIHRLGYVHRDLKPENILLLDGTWRLADFGLVAIPDVREASRLTSTATSWATAAYCAPEQAIDFKHVDRAVDVYAFGCILHDIVGARPRVPFQSHTARGPVGAIVSRCTHVDPRQRFKTIGALRSALLDALSRGQPGAERASTEAWRDALARIHEWEPGKLDELVVHLEDHEKGLCAALDEERIAEIHGVDAIAWRRVALAYCEYAQGTFAFAYCDVVTSCLVAIFELGDVEIRAAAALALAVLASTHDRWSALRKVLAMCGEGLDVDVAERLAIDLRASEREPAFRKCAEAARKPLTVFHPRIAAVIAAPGDTTVQPTVREGRRGPA